MKDKNWLNKELDKSITGFNGRELSRYEMGRLDGYTHASMLLDELDEPEKTVLPKFVADWIEETKKQGKSLVFAITHIYYKNEIGKSPNKEENKIFQWMELAYNEEVFARAWIDGYEVEKEKLYHVRAGNRYVRFNLDGSIIGVKKDNSIVCLERLSKLPFDYKKAVESGIITLEEVTD